MEFKKGVLLTSHKKERLDLSELKLLKITNFVASILGKIIKLTYLHIKNNEVVNPRLS